MQVAVLGPVRVLGGDRMGPLAMMRTLRRLRSTAAGYLDKRGLDRPMISWDEYRR